MRSLLTLTNLSDRIEIYCEHEIRAGRLLKHSWPLLKEALISGQFERGMAPKLTGYKDRQARSVLNKLVERGLLISDSPKGSVRLACPPEVVEYWFPRLYSGRS